MPLPSIPLLPRIPLRVRPIQRFELAHRLSGMSRRSKQRGEESEEGGEEEHQDESRGGEGEGAEHPGRRDNARPLAALGDDLLLAVAPYDSFHGSRSSSEGVSARLFPDGEAVSDEYPGLG